jgi:hypothetical protein
VHEGNNPTIELSWLWDLHPAMLRKVAQPPPL